MPPVEISFSRIQTYQRCPWMYHLVYNLGWRSGPNSGMAMGLSLHRTLEAYHNPTNTEKTFDRLMNFFDEFWVNEGFRTTQETLDAYDQGRKILERYFKTDASRTSTVISTEKEFHLPMGENVHFRWTLDRLDQHPDGSYEIVEYKSNPHNWTEERRSNDLQMTLYAWGMKKALGTSSIKLKYYFLSSNEQITAHRNDAQLRTAEALINSVAEKIHSGSFEPNFDHCSKCEFSNRCTKYRKPSQE